MNNKWPSDLVVWTDLYFKVISLITSIKCIRLQIHSYLEANNCDAFYIKIRNVFQLYLKTFPICFCNEGVNRSVVGVFFWRCHQTILQQHTAILALPPNNVTTTQPFWRCHQTISQQHNHSGFVTKQYRTNSQSIVLPFWLCHPAISLQYTQSSVLSFMALFRLTVLLFWLCQTQRKNNKMCTDLGIKNNE